MRADDKNITVFNNQVGSVEALFGADADTAIAVNAEYMYSPYGEIRLALEEILIQGVQKL